MKIVLPGGTGFLGQTLIKSFLSDSEKHDIVVLSRGGTTPSAGRLVPWDARTLGEWVREIDGADVVINLTGKSVKCLYTDKTLKTLRDSRVFSNEVVGQAIKQAVNPPAVWIQMSTSSIYAHSVNTPNDEQSDRIGEAEDAPQTWKSISELAQDWEKVFNAAKTEQTRKVLIRCGVVMGLKKGSAFDILVKLSRWGLGGSIAGGQQIISWIHESDFARAIRFLMEKQDIKGPVNVSSPHPLSQGEFMKILRETAGMKVGLPATRGMIELSSYLTGIDSELSLKSRYALPGVLLKNGFSFDFQDWKACAENLFSKSKSRYSWKADLKACAKNLFSKLKKKGQR